ncbi:hypothetical protein EYF80_010089 [Liparis tanakae]|uniref:Uncharacterized protein n=1 Tax=Liparis tanakae TaxID=230148 RepID=A0A4Z2IP88_9TELE|nr:hypothetical protein EYF80_010089 [Liparis tanakae]
MSVNKRNSLADVSPPRFYWVFELHNHSSGCDPWSDSADPRIKAALPTCASIPCESTKARAVRLTLSVADLQHPSRLRREPTRPRQDTLLDDFKRRHSALNFITSHERESESSVKVNPGTESDPPLVTLDDVITTLDTAADGRIGTAEVRPDEKRWILHQRRNAEPPLE